MTVKDLAEVIDVIKDLKRVGKRYHFFMCLKEVGRPVKPASLARVKEVGAELALKLGLQVEWKDTLRGIHVHLTDGKDSIGIDHRTGIYIV